MPSVNRTVPGVGVPSTNTSADGRYGVASGDTLNKIASRFGVTVDQLIAANQDRYPKITDPKALQVGWQLQIPNGNAPAQPHPAQPPADGWKPRSNDKVLFVAVNNSAEHRSTDEAQAIINRGTDVTLVKPSKVPDQITVNGRNFDLSKPEGSMGFALTLGLPAEQTKNIAKVIDDCQADGRDELAGIAQEWAKAERGGQTESRLILSGHQTGSGVYGDNNGKITWESLAGLARAMPRGAKSVEDLMIAGCFSGGETMMGMYQDMFPNLHTAVAYDGLSPGAASGAVAHQRAWEQATRGDRSTVDRNIFQNFRWGDHVAVWSKDGGYKGISGAATTLDQARQNLQSARWQYEYARDGNGEIGDPTTGPVRQFYTAAQHLLQRADFPAAEKPALEAEKDQAIRLVFYGQVASKFAQVNAGQISDGFKAMGLPVPDFSKLSRADALTAIKGYQDKLGAMGANAPAAATQFGQFLSDFQALKNNVVPEAWV